MCRNIKTLHNFDPPATDEEIRAASLQFVRKLSGFNRPSQANEQAFEHAVDQVAKRRATTARPAGDHEPHPATARSKRKKPAPGQPSVLAPPANP